MLCKSISNSSPSLLAILVFLANQENSGSNSLASNLAFLASCQIPPSQRAFIRARIRVAIATPVDAVKPSPRAQLLPRPLPSPRSFSRARETFAVRAQLLPRVDIEYFEDAASVSLAVTLALIKMCRVNEILGSKKKHSN